MLLDVSQIEHNPAAVGPAVARPAWEDVPLDFARPFLPEALAATGGFWFLDRETRRVLNQIRAHGYLYTIGLVIEDIVPLTLGQMADVPGWDDARRRGMHRAAAAERRRVRLPARLRGYLEVGIGTRCDLVGPASDLAASVLAHRPMAAALIVQQLLWVAQRHDAETIHGEPTIDPAFKRLLRRHWTGAAWHLRLVNEMVGMLAATMDNDRIADAGAEYAAIGGYLEAGLQQQVRHDTAALMRATGRALHHTERDRIEAEQLRALRWTYLRPLA